jgi:hypothetical protein
LVADRKIGINLCRDDLAGTATCIAQTSPEENLQMRQATLATFHELFAENVFAENLRNLL